MRHQLFARSSTPMHRSGRSSGFRPRESAAGNLNLSAKSLGTLYLCGLTSSHKSFRMCSSKTKSLKSFRICRSTKTYTYSLTPSALYERPCPSLTFESFSAHSSVVASHCSLLTGYSPLSPACILRHLSQNRSVGSRHMEEFAKLASLPFLGEADPVPQSLFLSFPEQAKTLTLLYDISRELTAILDRETLLRSIAQHVKKLVNYHVFTVMLWNEKTQLLEGVFGTAAADRKSIRVPDVKLEPRYIHCDVNHGVRSELVVPLLLQDKLIGVLDLESTVPQAFSSEHERMLTALSAFIAIALENS